jgi:putative spermidine/putrescine transport system ATP-binding protein
MRDSETDHAFVRFAEVQKTYDGESLVVKNLNLQIRRGEFLTLLGPSGSGKTTTLMMLAGFEMPTHGEIRLAGKPIDRVPPEKRNIGMVFQNYALFPHMTVAENLAFPLQVRRFGKGEIAAKVARVLDMVQLSGFMNRRPGQLSGGQQQRVALARALVFEPKLVLMDEPLGALDKQLREQMQIEIKHLHGRLGVTVIYVTHDQGEALTMSDRVAVFHEGAIQQIASPAELYDTPCNSFVAQFIGENNRLRGRVTAMNGSACTVAVDDGSVIAATPVNIAGVGLETMLSLRPERVKLGALLDQYANRFTAKVVELIYFGDHTRARVSVCGSEHFMIKIAHSEAQALPRPGDLVTIGWRPEDCRALDTH